MLLASHPVTVYYAAYGVAASGLIVAQVFLLAFVFRYLRKPSAFSIFAIVFSAFMLTLTYAPGRLAALGTLGGLAMILLHRCVQGPNRRIALMHFSFAAIITLAIGVTEWFAGGAGFFLNARGEQVLAWRDGSGNLVLNERPDRARRSVAEFAETVVLSRVQELGKVLSPKPLMRERPSTPAELGDPPELPYLNYGSLLFITLGICHGVVRYRQHLFIILIQVLATLIPLLFTTRIDTHRVLPLLVPMQISLAIGATGLCEWIRIRRPSVTSSSWFSVPLVAGLVGTQILSVSSYLRPRGVMSPVARTVQAVVQKSKAQSIGLYGPGYCGAQYTAFPLAFSQLLQGQRQKVQIHSGDPTALLAAAHEQMVRDKWPELSVVVGVTPEAVAALPTRASSVSVTYIHDGVGVLTQLRN